MSSPVGDLLVRRAGRIVTQAGPPIDGPAAVSIRGGVVAWVGPDDRVPWTITDAPELDAGGACVVPGFVDPHTHALWAGSRREEFAARLAGKRYDGGGIASTVAATTAASDDELVELAAGRLRAMAANGTTTVEVKTGYGLGVDAELRLLGLLRRVANRIPVRVEPTLLAHVVPADADRAEHVEALAAAMPEAARLGARWVDVFCDRGAYTVEEARRLLQAAAVAGLGGRLHAEQLSRTGAAELAAECGCASADHLEQVDAAGARAMAAAGVAGVLLPTATLSTGGGWDSARILREAGVVLALGTDCNPGTSWCESLPFALQLAGPLLGLTVDEALRAATAGGAAA
ncbi:MAG TPA: imidazolonepropionase, partial [Mycobacteriales bacterium]|nr:imidazolonepropionase [Mycobacteriales bacterium]